MNRTSFIALLFAVAFGSRTASADAAHDYQRGLEAFKFGKWDVAVRALAAAAPLLESAADRGIAFRTLGLASIELGDDKTAEDAFHSALSIDPAIELEPLEVSPRAFNAFRRVKDRLEGTLKVDTKSGADSARVVIDGVEVGMTPYVAKTRIGLRKVQLRTADGRVTGAAMSTVVRVGAVTELTLAPPPTPAKIRIDGELPPPRLVPMLRPRHSRSWGFVATGVSAAALLVGTVLYVGATAPMRDDRAAYESELDGYNARVRAGGGLLISGGLVAAAAVTLFALHRDARPVTSLAPDLPTGPGSFGVLFSKRF